MICACTLQATATGKQPRLTDDELMTLVQKQTFRYFWDFAHPESGLARERSNDRLEIATIGGSGFGVMAIIVGVERGFITREQGAERLLKIVEFLNKADSYHGIWAHWMDGATGKTIPFSRKDDGADLVESAFMFEGLLAAHQYFTHDNPTENRIRGLINTLWHQAEWDWFTRGGEDVLYWHWSPNNGWAMNHQLKGQNECHITYILAASSPTYPIRESVYHKGWANSITFKNGKEYYGIRLPLGTDFGGPLFFTHYSYLGLDPRGLRDRYCEDYFGEMRDYSLINRAYCIRNPKHYKGYGKDCWGLTASYSTVGYAAHAPVESEDHGVIAPTAALSSIVYTPEESMDVMRYLYGPLQKKVWGPYGFYDAFSETDDWYPQKYLAIDQGPIAVMIENHRSELLWRLFMSHPDVQNGLRKLGFESPVLQ
mgnify:CR=1 FL=1